MEVIGSKVTYLYINLPYSHFNSTDEIETKATNFLEKAYDNLSRKDRIQVVADYSVEGGILNYAKKTNASLIAMNTHGRTGLGHFLGGSISEDLANHANLPVIIFKL